MGDKKFLKHFKIAGRVDETDLNNTCEFHLDRPSELHYQISTRRVYYLVASGCNWISYLKSNSAYLYCHTEHHGSDTITFITTANSDLKRGRNEHP